MDGIQSTSHIRRHEKEQNLTPSRIMAVTGLGSAETLQEALAAGVDDYMVKPISLKSLKKVMNLGWRGPSLDLPHVSDASQWFATVNKALSFIVHIYAGL